jgi:hypothetical protein
MDTFVFIPNDLEGTEAELAEVERLERVLARALTTT